MNLTKIFSYLYILTFSTMFLFLGASEWRETLQFLSFGAEKQAVIVANLNEGLMDQPDAEVEPSHILAKVFTGDINQVKAISKVPLYRPRVGDRVSVLVIGKRSYVKINNWLSLYFKGTFYVALAVISVMAGLWALRSQDSERVEQSEVQPDPIQSAAVQPAIAQAAVAQQAAELVPLYPLSRGDVHVLESSPTVSAVNQGAPAHASAAASVALNEQATFREAF